MAAEDNARLMETIRRFVAAADAPVVAEPGMDPIPLTMGSWEVLETNGRITFQAWTASRNFVRRVVAVLGDGKARVDLSVERFGQKTGTVQLLDVARPAAEKLNRKNGRMTFRESFRRMLTRQFPRFRLVELSSEPDLQHSLSGVCSRAFLKLGGVGWAAVGTADAPGAEGVLAAGLIWLDYLRRREPRAAVEGLAVFVPAGAERTLCHRIRHLRRDLVIFSVFSVADGWEHPVDIADAGNTETILHDRTRALGMPSWMTEVAGVPGVETVELEEGHSFRVNGLEFARCIRGNVSFGIGSRHAARTSNVGEMVALARELARLRSAGSGGDLARGNPERWLESMIRRNLREVDAGLLPAPVYGQAPTVASGERGVIDLLAAGIDGRLTVVEVKASEDLNLPLQALDYWARVKWHLEAGDFARSGYFPGVGLAPRAPRMLLVAPALHFHPTTETILRFFPPELEVERIGLSSNWRTQVKVVFRGSGCDPVSM